MVRRVITTGLERRSPQHPLGFRCATVFTLVAAIAAAGYWLMPAKALVGRAQPGASAPAPVLAAAAPTLAAIAPPARAASAARPVYPLSVVAGGVIDRAELKRVVRRDAVVAAHYATFNVDAARVVRNAKPRAVHVSYRKGDQIFWTKKKVMLASNETLLSDGVNEMRTRCANRISDVAMLPVASDEPTEELLNAELAPDAPHLLLAGDDHAGNGRDVLLGNSGAGGHAGAAAGGSDGGNNGDMSQSRSQGRSAAAGRAGSSGGAPPAGWTNVGLDLGDVANAGKANQGAPNNGGETANTGSNPQAGAPSAGSNPDNAGNPVAGNTPANGHTPVNGSSPGNGSMPGNGGTPSNGGTPDSGINPVVTLPAAESSDSGDLVVKPVNPPFIEPGDAAFPPIVGLIKPELIVGERPPLWQPDTLPVKLPPAAAGDSSDVPEPATIVMVISALALLGALRRRQGRGAGAAAGERAPR